MSEELSIFLPEFGSYSDEKFMFGWLDSIDGVIGYEGVGRGLSIRIAKHDVNEIALRDLVALFMRYDLDCKSLKVFKDEHHRWFESDKMYWYESVFGE